MKKFKKLDIIISSIFFIIALGMLIMTNSFPESTAAFPKMVLYVILVLCILVVIESYKRGVDDNNKIIFLNNEVKNAFKMFVLVFIYFILFNILGFLISTILFIVTGAWYLGSKSIIKSLIVALVFDFFVYMAFTKFLSVPIPLLPIIFR